MFPDQPPLPHQPQRRLEPGVSCQKLPAVQQPLPFPTTPTYPLPASNFTQSIAGFDPNVQIPFSDSWQAGVTRSLGRDKRAFASRGRSYELVKQHRRDRARLQRKLRDQYRRELFSSVHPILYGAGSFRLCR